VKIIADYDYIYNVIDYDYIASGNGDYNYDYWISCSRLQSITYYDYPKSNIAILILLIKIIGYVQDVFLMTLQFNKISDCNFKWFNRRYL